MLLIECSKIKKYFGDKLIIDVDSLKIYSDDRIGIVGINGVGKTTLIDILSQRLEPDEGLLKLYGKYSFISQLDLPESKNISKEMASKFGIKSTWDGNMSGGEKTRFKLAEALDNNSVMIFADEPTSNLDIEGIELIEKKFLEYKGALIVISHDRNFLDKLCNQILEIENGKIKIYNGNYSDYEEQKAQEIERAQFEYEEYVNEKKRLEEVIYSSKQKVKSIRKAPKRMGNSEARLHKMGNQKAKTNLDRAVKNIEKRIEHLEVKEKPKEQSRVKLDILNSSKLYSKIIIEGNNINKVFDNKIIFKNAEFKLHNGSRVALIGPNGSGKSTLIKMIMKNDDSIRIAQGAKIGYFSQDMDILNKDLSIIENVMYSSIYPENFARLLLARLLFKGESIYKKIDILSGGERVKVSFAKILLQDINLLILDEPTNYVDINTIKVMEETLREYDRTLLFVSHDRRFIDVVANQIMIIESQEIKAFSGNYMEYLSRNNKQENQNKEIEEQIIILKNRLTEVLGRLSMPSKQDDIEALDKEYYIILDKLKKLKE
ncbi:putative ABC transporter ATP-binding protein YheS [Clostridium homopropionicum DSM 5847]|uniref:Putative ABC transporter ATP-binding protein YheS n=1 Tax=Clostridium homopropionicum DSM 5847 TaxID=1121318 RepID=A0A0L6Z8H9_9CLOT|nr:ABC-F type ribosomal protection protein [Clostridium homopropionicum]KOA19276.1 putative ABC transporter ATP-binding protein YheS [Clostridium homopropionicum DSM 5847]SFG19487.1 macrolide transport system ATP-binding/permease protein [Clostridium homopropionicum]